MTEKDEIVRCPSCGGRDVRRSHSRGLLDSLLAAVHRYPMRCRSCQRRFYLFQPEDADELVQEEQPPKESKVE